MLRQFPRPDHIRIPKSRHTGARHKILLWELLQHEVRKHCLRFRIVKRFTYNVRLLQKSNRIFRCNAHSMYLRINIGIDLPQILYHRLCLGHSDLCDLVLLTVKIRNIHAVKIHQDQFTNAGTRQCGRYVRAKSAQSTNSNCCSRKCFLPFLSMAHRERRHPFFLCGDSRALFPVHRHFINHLLQS